MVILSSKYKQQVKKAKKKGYKGVYVTTGGRFGNRSIKYSDFGKESNLDRVKFGKFYTSRQEAELNKKYIQYSKLMKLI
jgi:formylmethanofuran dehydrogenase subunit E